MNEPSFLSIDPKRLKSDERIVVAAMRVFADYPLEKASLRMIAKEAGISFSAITYYFKTKENLYREVIVRILEYMASSFPRLREEFPTDRSVEAAKTELRGILIGMSERLYGNSNASIPVRIILREHISPSSVYETIFQEYFRHILDRITLLVRILCDRMDERRASLQAFSIIGQLIAFRIERELMVRKLGWTGFSAEEIEELQNVLLENVFRQLGVPS